MSRFHQRLREDLSDPEFAEAFYDMSVDIALLQVLEQARVALNVSEKELAERMGVQRTTVTRLFNASHPNPTLDTISDILRAPGFQASSRSRYLRRTGRHIAPGQGLAPRLPGPRSWPRWR